MVVNHCLIDSLISAAVCLIGLLQFVVSADELLADAPNIIATSLPTQQQRHFWIGIAVEQIHLRPECISAQLCAEPRFSLINQMPKYNERLFRDWAMSKAEVPGISLEFFTFWSRGMPSDVTIQALVHGSDPKFKFSRTCDESSFVSVFQFASSKTNDQSDAMVDNANAKVQLELHGLCFNATLSVELFRHRCPWCFSDQQVQKPAAASLLCQIPLQLRTNLLIVLLAVATGINVIAFVGLLLICERQRRNSARERRALKRESQQFSGQIIFPRRVQPQQQQQRQQYVASSPFINNSSNNRLHPTKSQRFLPTISEEFYEVIDEDDAAFDAKPTIPLHFAQHNKSKTAQRTLEEPNMVQLPLSNKCDHCFLRLRGDDRCSCASLNSSLESNFGNSFTDENDEHLNDLPASSPNAENATDSGLDGSNHTEEEKT